MSTRSGDGEIYLHKFLMENGFAGSPKILNMTVHPLGPLMGRKLPLHHFGIYTAQEE